jgi:L-fuconolactonase
MIIDAHQHFWKFDPIRDSWITNDMNVIRRDFFPADLQKTFEDCNVEGSVAVQADQSEKETDFLLSLAEENNIIKGVVGWVDLKAPDAILRLHHYQSFEKLKGFRAIMQGQPDEAYLTNKDFHHGISQLSALGFKYDVLIYHYQFKQAIKFTEKFPDQDFILDHLGKPDIKNGEIKKWKESIRILAQNPKMFCKLSGIITEADWKRWRYEDVYPYLEIAAENFGVDRICFGSDWPVCLVAGSYRQVLEIVFKFLKQVNQEDGEKILSGNISKFYNLT